MIRPMDKKDKVKQIQQWYKEGKIKRLGILGYSVPSEASALGITSTLVDTTMRELFGKFNFNGEEAKG